LAQEDWAQPWVQASHVQDTNDTLLLINGQFNYLGDNITCLVRDIAEQKERIVSGVANPTLCNHALLAKSAWPLEIEG
jgi:hypothetical protein